MFQKYVSKYFKGSDLCTKGKSNIFCLYFQINRLYIFWGELGTLVFLFTAALWGTLFGCFVCLCLITVSYSVADSSYQYVQITISNFRKFIYSKVSHSITVLKSQSDMYRYRGAVCWNAKSLNGYNFKFLLHFEPGYRGLHDAGSCEYFKLHR